jgi:RNA polymerase sigma-70 factor, ECF subfamily
LEDKLLIFRFKCGSNEALRRIYEKYRVDLLNLAAALLCDVSLAEDVVHDVFIRFAQSADRLRLGGSLKSYLRTCVINAARNKARAEKIRSTVGLENVEHTRTSADNVDHWITLKEQSTRISHALSQIPFEQREAVVLHVRGDLKFREIARLQGVSLKTIQSRYRYGLEKLRSLLDSEVKK